MNSPPRSSLFSAFLHLRPRSWPIVFIHCAVGGLLGLNKIEWGAPDVLKICLAGGIWAVLLNGGTLALNSAFDRDEGDIGYLDNPPPIPKGLAFSSLLLLLLGLVLAWFISTGFFVVYLICFVLSLLYSVPPFRLKAVAGFDLLVNMLGYGALTLLAGWFAVEPVFRQAALFSATGFAFLFAALYPMTQIYQYEEDLRNNARGLTVRLGPRRALMFAHFAMGFAFANFAALYLLYQTSWPGFLAFVISLAAWMVVLFPWSMRFDSYPHKKGMYRGLRAWAITEALLAIIWLGKIISVQ